MLEVFRPYVNLEVNGVTFRENPVGWHSGIGSCRHTDDADCGFTPTKYQENAPFILSRVACVTIDGVLDNWIC
jgi:hypothetical protein